MTPRFDHWPDWHGRLTTGPLWVGLDFDGTLTHHTARSEHATLSPAMSDRLSRLADIVPTAIISGRSLDDVRARVGLTACAYAGNHGLEWQLPGQKAVRTAGIELADTVRMIMPILAEFPHADLENKLLSLSINMRTMPAPSRSELQQRLTSALVGRPGLNIHHLEFGTEIRPRSVLNKGTACQTLRDAMADPRAMTVYIGDDRTDEDAFAALPDALTIHVGTKPTLARYRLEDCDAVGALLDHLINIRGRA
jgi:trehalose 6-phosphate phosphatase